jgi:hypothetical protein
LKPIRILEVLKLATAARKNDDVFNPLFTGDAGLGKSQICQKFVDIMQTTGFPDAGIDADPNYGFLDLRIAYYEAPDLIGFPENVVNDRGERRTVHSLPEFWPTRGNGLILLEEPNRGTTGVMNCLMQLLTDRKVNKYTLPEGWIVASCINPDTAEYDVNAMDAALRNRFEEYEVEYDAISFIDYIESAGWFDSVQLFIKSGVWVYRDTKSIGDNGKYISPRTWSKVNAAEKAGVGNDRRLHRETMTSILGRDIGNEYHKFCYDEAPVTAKDLIADKKKAFKRLEKQSDPNSYKGDMIAVTVESIAQYYSCGLEDDKDKGLVGETTMAEVAKIIPSDQAINLIKQCGFKQSKGSITTFFRDFVARHPDLTKVLKGNIRLDRSVGKE